MDKIFEMLGAQKLDEAKQNELKETLQTVIELKAQDIAEGKVEELVESKKQELVKEYEEKFDTYKDSVTTKFSNFVDNILDEEMVIPENIIKYARLGELYEDLIDQFKTRLAIDEGMISGEVKDMLSEAKEEIETLRSKVDESTGQVLELEKDASEMAAQLYVRQKCDGLTEAQKKKVINILGDEVVKESIDKKFKMIVESLNIIGEGNDTADDGSITDRDGSGTTPIPVECPECGNKETLKEEDSDMTCPECGAKMKKAKTDKDGDDADKKDDKKDDKVDESKSPWGSYRDIWLNSLKSE